MFICQVSAGPKIGVCLFLALLVNLTAVTTPISACPCTWQGPFLAVAPGTPLVVRGQVLRHHPGPSPAMDILVVETLSADRMDRILGSARRRLLNGSCAIPLPGVIANNRFTLTLWGV